MTPKTQKLIAELRARRTLGIDACGDTSTLVPSSADALCQSAADMLEAQAADIEDLKTSVVAFGAPAVVAHAKKAGLPDGYLHPHHYDILKNAGARMDCFVRATLTTGEPTNE